MPKRKRLFTPLRHKTKINISRNEYEGKVKKMFTARGRLQGALMEVLEPTEDSDESPMRTPAKRERQSSNEQRSNETDDDDRQIRRPQRQSYVLKLFDRSVDLSQFSEDSPLYPICRAWIANKPKADYSEFGKKYDVEELSESRIDLPGPEGPILSKIPELLPEQKAVNKDNINLNYDPEDALPSRGELLQRHVARWTAVRAAWVEQSNRAETRYEATQQFLNKINVNAL